MLALPIFLCRQSIVPPAAGLDVLSIICKKSACRWQADFLCWRYLSSRAVTRKVLSAQMSLTSVFGMGTGVPSPQSTPTIYLSSGLCPRTFIIIPPLDSLVKRFFGDPSGIRTHVNGVRGRCLNHLTMGPWCTFTDSNRGPTD